MNITYAFDASAVSLTSLALAALYWWVGSWLYNKIKEPRIYPTSAEICGFVLATWIVIMLSNSVLFTWFLSPSTLGRFDILKASTYALLHFILLQDIYVYVSQLKVRYIEAKAKSERVIDISGFGKVVNIYLWISTAIIVSVIFINLIKPK